MTHSPPLVRAIREHDRAGCLINAGAEWREESRFGMYETAILGMVCVGVFFYSIALVHGGRYGLQPLWLTAVCVAGFVFVCRDAVDTCLPRRAIFFRRDGSVYVPRGIPFDRRAGELGWTQDIFRSIELRKTREHGFAVDIHTSEGDAIMIGWKMSEAAARKLAVQLTKALRELREAIARDALDLSPEAALAMAGHAMHGCRNGAATAEFVID